MKRVLHGIDSVSEWTGKVLSMFLYLMIGVMVFEITARYIFNAPTIWAHETSQHMFGAYAALGGVYVLLHLGHVKVDIFYSRFSLRGRAVLDSITALLFFLFMGVLLFYGLRQALDSIKVMEVAFTTFGPPIWPLKLTIPIAAFLFILQGLAHFVRNLSTATGKSISK